jgi:DNA primase
MTEIRKSHFVGFDRLKRSVSMEQVLQRYGLLDQLRRSGDSLTGVCPLHAGHNPTQFRVSLARNCWICFGDCHGGGSIIDFVSRKEHIGIREAGLLLQDWFSLESADGPGSAPGSIIPYPSPSSHVAPGRREANLPLRFSLPGLDAGHAYLRERGLTTETIETFGVGACARGMLRGWIAIPIHDGNGRLIAYAGRWPGVPPEGVAKYRLPRGFRKSLELFNQHRASIQAETEPLVVVEGFFGCMWVWQAGHRKVVALMGSMLSRAQEERLVELVSEHGSIVLLFDGDAAGRKGGIEAYRRWSRRVLVHIVRLADGQQPDDVEPTDLLELIHASVGEEVAA